MTDYDKLAAAYGGVPDEPKKVDYTKLAAAYGGTPAGPNAAQLNPEVLTSFGSIKGESDGGFNPAAAIIASGRTLDRLNAGMRQAKLTAGKYIYGAMGLDNAAGENQSELDKMAAQQADATQQYKGLQEVHPGSTTIGSIAPLAPIPPALLPAFAATEYGTPGERATNAGAALLGNKLMQKGGEIVSRGVSSRVAASNAAAPADAATKQALDAGFVLPPSQVNPTLLNRAVEGFAGKASTQQALAIKNEPVVTQAIKADLGMAPADRVTPEALQAIRAKAYNTGYAPIKQQTGLVADQPYQSAVQNLGGPEYAAMVREVPEIANPKIADLASALDKPQFSGSTTVNLIRKLRSDSKTNFKNYADPGAQELAQAQKAGADALEGMVERNLAARGMNDAVDQFRAARTLIAKTHTAEDALNPAGNFVAKEFARAADKGVPVSGNQKMIADLATTYPRAFQEVTSSMPGISPLDYAAVGGIAAAAHNPSILASLMGRPAARAAITSSPYQTMMVRPKPYNPGLLGDMLPSLLDNPMSRASGGLLALSAIR